MSPSDEAAVSRFLNALRPLAEMTRASGARAIPLEGSGGGRQSQDYGDAALDAMALYGAPARALRARLARCSAETRLVVKRIEAMCHGAPSAVAGLYAKPTVVNNVETLAAAALIAAAIASGDEAKARQIREDIASKVSAEQLPVLDRLVARKIPPESLEAYQRITKPMQAQSDVLDKYMAEVNAKGGNLITNCICASKLTL